MLTCLCSKHVPQGSLVLERHRRLYASSVSLKFEPKLELHKHHEASDGYIERNVCFKARLSKKLVKMRRPFFVVLASARDRMQALTTRGWENSVGRIVCCTLAGTWAVDVHFRLAGWMPGRCPSVSSPRKRSKSSFSASTLCVAGLQLSVGRLRQTYEDGINSDHLWVNKLKRQISVSGDKTRAPRYTHGARDL